MVSMSFQGHINPVLKFAKRLISKGIHVTIATTEEGRHRMLKHNNNINHASSNNTDSNSQNSKIKLEFFSDGLSFDFDRSDSETLVNTIREKGTENLSNLITNLTKLLPYIPFIIVTSRILILSPVWMTPNEKVHLPGLPIFEVRDLPSFMLPSCPRHFKEVVMDLYQALDKVKWVLETEGRGLVVKWCPQEKVLMHPAVACFVSHDQPTNAMLIADVFQNGVKVNYGEDGIASAEEIERCIRDVMEGPSAEEMKKRGNGNERGCKKSVTGRWYF
ncbi:UDP-glycosyltransferase 84B2-like protein [Sesbania bispinosa]|nr:UDP-glycosyltransferase 84B2-like protein [Sesbania bispinosa]